LIAISARLVIKKNKKMAIEILLKSAMPSPAIIEMSLLGGKDRL